ncbi:hypothetical protein MRX96_059861 [Rhipicephalus microplus]
MCLQLNHRQVQCHLCQQRQSLGRNQEWLRAAPSSTASSPSTPVPRPSIRRRRAPNRFSPT